MSVSVELWTCPACEVTEHLEGPHDVLDERRAAVMLGHSARHAAERSRTGSVADALADAIDRIVAFRVRLVVHPDDVERVRALVVRRSLPIEVFGSGLVEMGSGYVMQPRAGVRER